jgi:hypothetical protein
MDFYVLVLNPTSKLRSFLVYEYYKSIKTFTDILTGDYTFPVVMCKDINNKTEDEQKLEQVLDWIQHAVERDIAKHEEMDVDDVNVGSIITKSKDPTKSNILNLKNCFRVPSGYKFRKGVQLKADEKINTTRFALNFDKTNIVCSSPVRGETEIDYYPYISHKFNGAYYIVFDQISQSGDNWYVQMKLHTVLLEKVQEVLQNYSTKMTEFK